MARFLSLSDLGRGSGISPNPGIARFIPPVQASGAKARFLSANAPMKGAFSPAGKEKIEVFGMVDKDGEKPYLLAKPFLFPVRR
jgi:hypothetical protein